MLVLNPPVRGRPRVDSQQAVSYTLHSILRNLGAVQEADNLSDDVSIPQDQADHYTPLQTAGFHENMEEVPEGHSCQISALVLHLIKSNQKTRPQWTHLSCTCDLCGPLLASSMEMCSSSAWLRLRVEAFSSTIIQSPSTTELVSVRSVAEPMLYSSTTEVEVQEEGENEKPALQYLNDCSAVRTFVGEQRQEGVMCLWRVLVGMSR